MSLTPLILSPALPSELLTYIASHAHHPTTLIVCSPRADFLSSLINDVRDQVSPPNPSKEEPTSSSGQSLIPAPRKIPDERDHRLLQAPLHLVARTRHIRTLFIPTVSHLRALLSTFDIADSKIPPPPPHSGTNIRTNQTPLIMVYGMLELHRDTSEWSAQGLGSSTAGLVDAAARMGMRAVVIEPRKEGSEALDEILREVVPLLSATARRIIDGEGGGPGGRMIEVERVLSRWFEAKRVKWDSGLSKGGMSRDS